VGGSSAKAQMAEDKAINKMMKNLMSMEPLDRYILIVSSPYVNFAESI
jgi:hypothetical protein